MIRNAWDFDYMHPLVALVAYELGYILCGGSYIHEICGTESACVSRFSATNCQNLHAISTNQPTPGKEEVKCSLYPK